jgi:hypothetical protein
MRAKGTYLRIPAGMRVALTSASGCLLFIKRYEFEANDRAGYGSIPRRLRGCRVWCRAWP